jgi:hypothetical protein
MRTVKYLSIACIGVALLGGAPAYSQQAPDSSQPDQQQGQQQGQGQGQQQEQPAEPIPAIRSPLASAADNGDQDETANQQEYQPDTRSLTGVQELSVGSRPLQPSYWQPRVAFSGTVDSNPNYATGNSSWGTWASLLGGVDIHRISGISELLVSYTGGGMFAANDNSAPNGVVQELSVKDKYSFRRSTFSLFDQLNYLPESSFGFAGASGAGAPGVGGGVGLGNGFTPGQSILTPRSQNLSNAFDAEFDTQLSKRTSLTLVGGYSSLHYFSDNLLDFGAAMFQAGYNYQLNRKDTVAVSYGFSAYRYSNVDQSLNLHTIQGSFARRVTGRLAFQISAGPQIALSNSPITNSTGTTGSGTASATQLYWTLNSSLQYQLRRALLSASYNHGVTGGSGVLAGAETDVATGAFSEQVSRTFNAGLTGGYSRNRGFLATGGSAAQTYSYWFTGVNVTHPFGRSLDVFMSYQFQYQNSSTSDCTGTGCTTNVSRHQISFGVNLHKQPIPF